MYRAIIVDDEPLMREGLRTLINWSSLGFALVGEAADAPSALALAREAQPHVAILDIRMPGMDGTLLARRLKEAQPDLLILFFSGYKDFQYAHEAIRLQAFRYLLKPLDPQELEAVLAETATVLDSMHDQSALTVMLRAFIHGQNDAVFLQRLGMLIGTTEGVSLHALLVHSHLPLPTIDNVYASHHDDDTTILLWKAPSSQPPQSIMDWLGGTPHQHMEATSLGELGTRLQTVFAHRASGATPASQADIIQQLEKYIAQHYSASPSLQEFARTIGFHKGYLGQLIKQATGLSFHAHVANARFERAGYLLRQTNEPIRSVAEAVGIQDVDYFTAQFKRRTGQTPTQFRKRTEGTV